MTIDLLSDSLHAAPGLLGYKLSHRTDEGVASGIIVETEAYNSTDPASHTYRGQTARNSVMFGPPGHAYIYFTYGMHYCVNVVTGPVGDGQAVLIRALEPIEGLDIMKKRRHTDDIKQLTNGPAKLVQALGIAKADYGINLFTSKKLYIKPGIKPQTVIQTTRVGIRQAIEKPWRFYIGNNSYISKP